MVMICGNHNILYIYKMKKDRMRGYISILLVICFVITVSLWVSKASTVHETFEFEKLMSMTTVNSPAYGKIMVFRHNDFISEFAKRGWWEEHIATFMADAYVSGSDVLDIGANFGLSILGMNIKKKVTGTIYCFEPQFILCFALSRNLRHLSTPYHIYNIALSDKPELLSYSSVRENVGATQMQIDKQGKNTHVGALALDDLMKTYGLFQNRVSVMKIDVEGYEGKVLAGAIEFLTRHKPAIFIELWDEEHYKKCWDILHPLGYKQIYNNMNDYIFTV